MDEIELSQTEKIEMDLLLQAVYLKYGYDFRNYAKASMRRRIRQSLTKAGLSHISDMQHRILHDREFFDRFLLELTVNVTEMFRDPPFFKAVRETVLPALRGRSPVKVWHAGCATGEEAYSIAILFKEAGLLDKTRIYATDANEAVLATAKSGIYPLDHMRQYTVNYQKAGGSVSFSDYYTSRYENALMDQALRKSIVFSEHNLVTDGVFGDMDLILCRNVLIYFSKDLQDRVFEIFSRSLCSGGFLCLGAKETVRYSAVSDDFDTLLEGHRIYRKRVDPAPPRRCAR